LVLQRVQAVWCLGGKTHGIRSGCIILGACASVMRGNETGCTIPEKPIGSKLTGKGRGSTIGIRDGPVDRVRCFNLKTRDGTRLDRESLSGFESGS
jgi:hypothetical protein